MKLLICPDCHNTKWYIDIKDKKHTFIVCSNLLCSFKAEWNI